MKRPVIHAIALVAALASLSATASPKCTTAPRNQWLPEATMKARILKDGYTIREFKVSGQCYEIYGKDAKGNNVEIYFDPTDGRIVKQRGGN
jgi:hypothetical protein